MIETILSLIFFIAIILFVAIFLFSKNDFNKFHYFLYFVLSITWIVMFMFKNNPHLNTKGFIKNHWWSWPIIISLYQFVQVIFRLPLGKLSQKLKSRKEPILLVMFILLIGLVLVIASNFSDWSIIIGIIATGFLGSIFGLQSQYWSENWNIKRGFYSIVIMFTLPFAGKMFSSFINGAFTLGNINLFWVTFFAVILLTGIIIYYAVAIKEDKNTFFIDNIDPKAKPFLNKSIKDVLIFSISASLVMATFTFVTYIGFNIGDIDKNIKLILTMIQILFLILTPTLFLKLFNINIIRILSEITIFLTLVIVSLLLITNSLNIPLLIALILIANIAFGIYTAIMFSSILHFDHKYPALVLGIFLTIYSFFTGTSELSSQLLVNINANVSTNIIGIIALSISIIFFAIAWYIPMHGYIWNKKDKVIFEIVNDSYIYEYRYQQNSSKLVKSNKIVKK